MNPLIRYRLGGNGTMENSFGKSTEGGVNNTGITDSPLCRACMEADETPTHVLLRCRGVAEQRAAYLGSPASLPEALGYLGGLLNFWSELGWLE
ncbi:jg1601 [Pararge aegeria aegeria]|uniref:Jg1601 protein n=1 Tax=Pararge aegeria aegeria TaxID=348720 RepID=A0A8S4S1S6_9NEOP|nr:jg1601 [Pararge aegeria aegeria]